MSAYIQSSKLATSLGVVLRDEINSNKLEVDNNPDWGETDKALVFRAMDAETQVIASHQDLHGQNDSVKGEDAMPAVYSAYRGKATDAITLRSDNKLVLIEAKYLIKVGGCGPFGGPSSFKSRVAEKFKDMSMVMVPNGESIESLRIVVVTEEQLPLSVNHVHKLQNADYPTGSFSADGQCHNYVLCSSASLRTMVDNWKNVKSRPSSDYLFFTL